MDRSANNSSLWYRNSEYTKTEHVITIISILQGRYKVKEQQTEMKISEGPELIK